MKRTELYEIIDDCKIDFEILKLRVESFFLEQEPIISELKKVNGELIMSSDLSTEGYGIYLMNDIFQTLTDVENELFFLNINKDTRMRSELAEFIETTEERIKQASNKFKQLNYDIKEAYSNMAIKEKTVIK